MIYMSFEGHLSKIRSIPKRENHPEEPEDGWNPALKMIEHNNIMCKIHQWTTQIRRFQCFFATLVASWEA